MERRKKQLKGGNIFKEEMEEEEEETSLEKGTGKKKFGDVHLGEQDGNLENVEQITPKDLNEAIGKMNNSKNVK